jgi:hypothetical protein
MTPLDFVQPSAVAPTLNILLYGPGGTGKTVNACSAPGPILVGNAEGESALRFARGKWGDDKIHEKAITSAKDLDDIFVHVREGCEEKTLVIDSVGEVYQRLVEELAGSGRASLQNYGDVNTKIERFVRAIKDLPINVVLIAHEQLDEDDGASIKRPATGGKKLPEKLVAAVDVVGYCAVIPEADDAPRRYVAQLVEANGRRAKDRSGSLGKLRDVDLSEWIPTAVEAMSGGQQELATEPPVEKAEGEGEGKKKQSTTTTAAAKKGGN